MGSSTERLPILQSVDATNKRHEHASKQRRTRWLALGTALVMLVVGGSIGLSRSETSTIVSASPFEQVMAMYRAKTDVDAVVQVTIDGQRVFDDWDGKANEEFNVAMTKQSIFAIGSNSKLFTSVALYQLQERGLVNLTDTVNGWLNQSDFEAFGHPNQTSWCPRLEGAPSDSPCEIMTFVQLLYMSSGIGDSVDCLDVPQERCYNTANDLGYYAGSIAPYVGRFINDPLVFRPGSNYSYANPNYVLLSYMIEKISQQSFGDYLQEHIFDKIGLKDTYYDPYMGALAIRPGWADEYVHYYVQENAEDKPTRVSTGTCRPYFSSGTISGSGGLWSSTEDMHKWYLDLFQDRGRRSKVLSEQSIRAIVERRNPVDPSYAQGVGVDVLVDGWPSAVQYCGGVKCTMTCLFMKMDPTQPNGSAIVSWFSNHQHMVFPDRQTWLAYHPTTFMGDESYASMDGYTLGFVDVVNVVKGMLSYAA